MDEADNFIDCNVNKNLLLEITPNVCECCLSEDNLKSMSDHFIHKEEVEIYSEMLLYCFSIEVAKKERPTSQHNMICQVCIEKLRDICSFRSQVEYTQSKLKNNYVASGTTQHNLKDLCIVKIENEQYPDENNEDTFDEAYLATKICYSPSDDTPLKNYKIKRKHKKKTKTGLRKSSSEKHENHSSVSKRKKTRIDPKIQNTTHDNEDENDENEMQTEKIVGKLKKSRDYIRSEARKRYARSLPYKLDKDALTCPICSETFAFNRFLVTHMALHYPNFICDLCGKFFVTRNGLFSHKRNTHASKTPCKICNKLLTRSGMNQHLRIHSGAKKPNLKCLYCPENFTTITVRAKHMSIVHNVNPYKYECKMCHKSFITSSGLSGHINGCHLKLRAKRVRQMNNADGKSKTDFSKYDERKHCCNVCDRAFTQKYKLIRHLKTHTDVEQVCQT